ncbi:MAG: SLC13 family permease [Acidimicrobiales bacterium]
MGDDGREGEEENGRLRWALPVALAVAVALAWFAPDDWDAGSGSLEVSYHGEVALSEPVEVGSADPIEAAGRVGGATIRVSIPAGLELDRPINAVVEVEVPGGVGAMSDVEVTIVDADGSREIVPIFQGEGDLLRASRQPVERATVVLGILGLAIVLWITEAVPLFVTSLAIPVALAVADVGSASDVLAPFFDPIIVLFFGGFLMAEAMRRAGLDRLVAVTIVAAAGRGARRLYVVLLGLAAFLSMWMSNTAAVAVLIPIAIAVTEPLDSPSYRKATVLGIAYAATIGGVGSAIGTPANPLAISFVEELTGREISFAEWFSFGLPMVLTFLPLMAAYLWVVSRVEVDVENFRLATEVARVEKRAAGPLTRGQIEVLAVFGVVITLWLSQSWHGLNTGIVALGGAIALFALRRIETADLNRISWPTLLTFGGGLTLGRFMVTTGTSDWVVTRLNGLEAWPEFLAVAAVAIVALGLTTVASNTAAAATLIPLAVPLAGVVGAEPAMLVVVVAVASSIDFALVIGTPPTMLAYSTELFTVREILRKGAPLNALGIVLLVAVVIPIWRLFGIV